MKKRFLILFSFLAILVVTCVIKSCFLKESSTAKQLTLSDNKYINEKSELKCKNYISILEVENQLGLLLLLHSENVATNLEKCEIVYDDNNAIRKVFLETNNFYNFDNSIDKNNNQGKVIELELLITPEYELEENKKLYESKNTLFNGEEVKNMFLKTYIDDLNLEVYIAKNNDDEYYPITICCFEFDNVLYKFKGKNVSEIEMIDFISNLRFY